VQKAIAAYELALTVYTKDADPKGWADTQYNLALIWKRFPGDSSDNLRKAIACFKGCATIYSESQYPSDYTDIVQRLLEIHTTYEATPAAATQPFDSIAPAE
jgi:hypothetical protein